MMKARRPEPAEICYKNMRFLITDRPTDANLDKFIQELQKHGVKDVVRVCEPTYSKEKLAESGVRVLDWEFDDGSPPPPEIVQDWFNLLKTRFSEDPGCCVAVHCVAGLGRAPVLVALALMEAGLKYEDAVEMIRELEVQADISEHAGHCERSSVGGESYSMSLNDDASTRALAGSIVSPKDKDGISLCSRHFDGNAHHYMEESSGKEPDGLSSSSGNGQQQRGSSSCPTSPHLRKASPAPSEDTRSTRSKKCTRFMDQVSEIESKSDCLSIGSIASNSSASPSCEGAVTTVPAYSTLSLTTTTTTTQAALASCESLMSEGKAEAIGAASISKHSGLSNGGRLKAESTSVLMDGADSRRCEMAGGRRKSDSTSRDDLNPADRSLGSRKKNGHAGNKEHRSQPGNLSDISEMKGMPVVSVAGCSDLLAVIDTSCENVFLDKRGQTKGRLMSASSSCSSSSDDPSDFLVSKRSCQGDKVVFEPPSTVVEDEANECCWPQSDTACSLSDVNMAEAKDEEMDASENHPSMNSKSLLSTTLGLKQKSTLVLGKEPKSKKSISQPDSTQMHNLSHESDKGHSDSDKCSSNRALCKRDSCVSRTSIGSDSASTASPLPDVEMPASFFTSASPRCKFNPLSSSVPSAKHSEPTITLALNSPLTGSPDTYKKPHTIYANITDATYVTFPASSKEQVPSKFSSENLPKNKSSTEEISLQSHSPEPKLFQSSLPVLHLARTTGSEEPSSVHTSHSQVVLKDNNSTDLSRISSSHAMSLQYSSQPKPSQEGHSNSRKYSGCLYTDL